MSCATPLRKSSLYSFFGDFFADSDKFTSLLLSLLTYYSPYCSFIIINMFLFDHFSANAESIQAYSKVLRAKRNTTLTNLRMVICNKSSKDDNKQQMMCGIFACKDNKPCVLDLNYNDKEGNCNCKTSGVAGRCESHISAPLILKGVSPKEKENSKNNNTINKTIWLIFYHDWIKGDDFDPNHPMGRGLCGAYRSKEAASAALALRCLPNNTTATQHSKGVVKGEVRKGSVESNSVEGFGVINGELYCREYPVIGW